MTLARRMSRGFLHYLRSYPAPAGWRIICIESPCALGSKSVSAKFLLPRPQSRLNSRRSSAVTQVRMPRLFIIDRYIVREVVAPFALGVGLLTFALVTGRLLKLTEMVVNRGVSLGEVGQMIGYIMPAFLELTFPMAVLLGVLLGFGRMSGEREITAARSCGISLYRLAVPVIFIGAMVWIISSWFAFSVRPWANRNFADLIYRITQTRSTAGLKEKIFNRTFPGMVLYVDHISPADGSLRGVMISDA